MRDLTELNKLEAYLRDHNYTYTREDQEREIRDDGVFRAERHSIVVFNERGKRAWDAICHFGSYGSEHGLLEVMGSAVVRARDSVEGWLTADEIIARLEETQEREA